jgi:hypothetical protein
LILSEWEVAFQELMATGPGDLFGAVCWVAVFTPLTGKLVGGQVVASALVEKTNFLLAFQNLICHLLIQREDFPVGNGDLGCQRDNLQNLTVVEGSARVGGFYDGEC